MRRVLHLVITAWTLSGIVLIPSFHPFIDSAKSCGVFRNPVAARAFHVLHCLMRGIPINRGGRPCSEAILGTQ